MSAGFDVNKFMQTNFKRREQVISVPDLKNFFPEDVKPEWKVRGLTGQELGYCNEAVERNSTKQAILDGIASMQPEEIKKAVSVLSGGPDVPDSVAKRISMLTVGSISPTVNESAAVKLCTVFPIEFYQITNTINNLTGQGQDPGK